MQPARDVQFPAGGLHLTFTASPFDVRDSLAQMLATPPLCDLPASMRGMAELVLAEVLNNVAEHAYPAGPGPVTVTLTPVAGGTQCLIVDQGLAMPGGRVPVGDLPSATTDVGDLPEGGFGWHLIHSLTRDLTYQRTGACNRLSFLLPNEG